MKSVSVVNSYLDTPFKICICPCIINISVCLEAHAVPHMGLPPGTHFASQGNTSRHLVELKG